MEFPNNRIGRRAAWQNAAQWFDIIHHNRSSLAILGQPRRAAPMRPAQKSRTGGSPVRLCGLV